MLSLVENTKKEARRPLQIFAKIWRASLVQLGERFLHCLKVGQFQRRRRLLGVLHGAFLVDHESRARTREYERTWRELQTAASPA